MGRFFIGSLGPSATVKVSLTVSNVTNPGGDWASRYALANPRNPGAELVCDFHSKLLNPATGRFRYSITITNLGPFATFFDVDF